MTITFNSSSSLVAFYLNGLADGTTSWTAGTIMQNAYSLVVGSGGATPIIGSLDDVRIYNRVLSSSEITQLYQGSQPINCDQYCVGWWKLDEASGTTTKDSTSNGNTGTLTNFTFDNTTNGWVSGVFGNGLLFNGSNDYVNLTNASVFNISGALTLSAWVKAGAFPSTGNQAQIIAKGYNGTITPYQLAIYNNGGTLQLNAATFNNPTSYGAYWNISGWTTGTWHHVVGEYDGTKWLVYFDGVKMAVSTNYPGPGSSSLAVTIGGVFINSSMSQFFTGSIDDIRIYNRALADYEIYDQYLAGR